MPRPVRWLKLAGVKDFDPFGDPPEENPDQAGNAIDGKQATAWTTLTYRGRPTLGGLKPGVGLVVDLGSIQNDRLDAARPGRQPHRREPVRRADQRRASPPASTG